MCAYSLVWTFEPTGLEPTIYRTYEERSDHLTTDTVEYPDVFVTIHFGS